ncbi:hypothetical protein CC78DRAFT_546965 [Lojkania enalia]|uniref:Uncharacterized protein n=1 Tax=Lojkania enalia TaxID=147567 RepID=A0A9P4K2R4_9PLEO|nr:hypothetical protein CC78DRAFT_546965 [Didymosphaeria enalia]
MQGQTSGAAGMSGLLHRVQEIRAEAEQGINMGLEDQWAILKDCADGKFVPQLHVESLIVNVLCTSNYELLIKETLADPKGYHEIAELNKPIRKGGVSHIRASVWPGITASKLFEKKQLEDDTKNKIYSAIARALEADCALLSNVDGTLTAWKLYYYRNVRDIRKGLRTIFCSSNAPGIWETLQSWCKVIEVNLHKPLSETIVPESPEIVLLDRSGIDPVDNRSAYLKFQEPLSASQGRMLVGIGPKNLLTLRKRDIFFGVDRRSLPRDLIHQSRGACTSRKANTKEDTKMAEGNFISGNMEIPSTMKPGYDNPTTLPASKLEDSAIPCLKQPQPKIPLIDDMRNLYKQNLRCLAAEKFLQAKGQGEVEKWAVHHLFSRKVVEEMDEVGYAFYADDEGSHKGLAEYCMADLEKASVELGDWIKFRTEKTPKLVNWDKNP